MDLLLLFGLAVVALVSYVIGRIHGDCKGYRQGCDSERETWRRAAINMGAAHWVCDPRTGEVEFEWLERESPE